MGRFNRFSEVSLRSTMVGLDRLGERCWFAHFKVDEDFSGLLPLIQSTTADAVRYASPDYLQFRMDGIVCSLYPPDLVVARFFYGMEDAHGFALKIIGLLNTLEDGQADIVPNFKTHSRLHVPELLPFLPMTNCGACGFKTCIAFAGAIGRRKANLTMCPDFPRPQDARIVFRVHDATRNTVREIEADPELAGVTIPDMAHATAAPEVRVNLKKRGKRSPGLNGSREGIVFKLSGREAEVLRLIAEGWTNKEMARILDISDNTVKSHVVHIFNKLGVNDRTQAAVWATQNDLI